MAITKHQWTDPVERTPYFLTLLGDSIHLTPDLQRAPLCREVLRLAQREAELLTRENDLGAEVTRLNRRIDADALRIAALQAVTGQRVHDLETQLAAEVSAHRASRQRISALERENRDKTLELAEKAEEIRSLNGAFEIANEENDRHIARIAKLEKEHEKDLAFMASCRARVEREETRIRSLELELAEKAEEVRQVDHARDCEMAAGQRASERIAELEKLAADRLDFIKGFHPQAVATGEENVRLQRRSAALEADLRFIMAHAAVALAHSGKPPAGATDGTAPVGQVLAGLRDRIADLERTASRQSDRMDALDRVLTDHADRLKAVAEEVDHLREDFLASTEDFQRRLAALEAGKE